MWTNQFTNLMKETQGDRTSENFLDLNNDLTFAIFMVKFLAPKYRFINNGGEINLVIIGGIPPSINCRQTINSQFRIPNIFFTSQTILECNSGLTQLRFFLQKILPVEIEKYGRINLGGSSTEEAQRENRIKDSNMIEFRWIIKKINTEEKFNLLIKSIRDIIVNELYKI